MARTQGFEGIDKVLELDLARLYVVALIERLMAFETDRDASALIGVIEKMLPIVEPERYAVALPDDLGVRPFTDEQVREIVVRAMEMTRTPIREVFPEVPEAVAAAVGERPKPQEPDDDEPVTLPRPAEPEEEDEEEVLAPAAEQEVIDLTKEPFDPSVTLPADDPRIFAATENGVVELTPDPIPPALFDMTRAEQVAYAITELGGVAHPWQIGDWSVKEGLYANSKKAKNTISSVLSQGRDRKFRSVLQGGWKVIPGWYEHDGSGSAPSNEVAKPEVASQPAVTAQASGEAACPMSPTGAHHWLLSEPNGVESSGKCKYCPAKRDDFKNYETFSKWDSAPTHKRRRERLEKVG